MQARLFALFALCALVVGFAAVPPAQALAEDCHIDSIEFDDGPVPLLTFFGTFCALPQVFVSTDNGPQPLLILANGFDFILVDLTGVDDPTSRTYWIDCDPFECHCEVEEVDESEFQCADVGACCANLPGTATECIIVTEEDCLANHHIFLGAGVPCGDDIDCDMLVVTMDSMSARAMARGVLVRWTTAMETDTAGFRVLRETVDANREKRLSVAAERIPSMGHGLSGASYEFLDAAAEARDATRYWLEDIDLLGRVTRHGPIAVDRGTRQTPRRRAIETSPRQRAGSASSNP